MCVRLQVVESLPRNSGRDRVPVFIYRQKVPRAVEPLPRPGDVTKHTVLNVFGDLVDGYFILDRLKVGSRRPHSNSVKLSTMHTVRFYLHP